MKTIRPQILKDANYRDMERQLKRVFYEIIFKPVSQALARFTVQPIGAHQTLLNAQEDALREALRSGRVQFYAGVFSGQFSAAIGRDLRTLGATWDRRTKVYRLETGNVPGWVRAEAAAFGSRAREAHDIARQKLDEIQKDLDQAINRHVVDPNQTVERFEAGFNKAVQGLIVNPKLSEASKERLSKDYQENMKLWIKKFSVKTIGSLREDVEKNAMQGYRFDNLIKSIKGRYGVTASKAKFLARQETGLFMAKYRRERFGEAGVTHYKWSTSHDARVRPEAGTYGTDNHRILDGRIFAYAQPPIVDTATGRKANPGEDYNCRCVDIAILESLAEAAA